MTGTDEAIVTTITERDAIETTAREIGTALSTLRDAASAYQAHLMAGIRRDVRTDRRWVTQLEALDKDLTRALTFPSLTRRD